MWLIAGLLVVLLAHAVPAYAGPGSLPDLNAQSAVGRADLPPAKGRLRFKSAGPVCMCSEGLSEKDIERAMVRQGLAKPEATEERDRSAMESKTPNGGVAR